MAKKEWYDENWIILDNTNTLTFQFNSKTKLLSFITEQNDPQFSVVSAKNENNRTIYFYSTPITDKYEKSFEYEEEWDD